MRKDRAEPDQDTPGRRLEAFVRARIKRSTGGMKGLASQMGTTTETMYSWFRGETEPQLGSITKIAGALGVSRVEVLAAIDGVLDEPSEAATRRIAREESAAAIREAIAEGRLIVPGEPQRGSRRAGGSQ